MDKAWQLRPEDEPIVLVAPEEDAAPEVLDSYPLKALGRGMDKELEEDMGTADEAADDQAIGGTSRELEVVASPEQEAVEGWDAAVAVLEVVAFPELEAVEGWEGTCRDKEEGTVALRVQKLQVEARMGAGRKVVLELRDTGFSVVDTQLRQRLVHT